MATERGRDYIATGRGGAGNMTRSPSRGRPVDKEAVEAAQTYAAAPHPVHAGRGGSGNVRSMSRDPVEKAKRQELDATDARLQAAALEKEKHQPHLTGRGGAGNVLRESSQEDKDRGRASGGVGAAIRSLSRSRSREPRSSSAARAPAEPGLASVDEKSDGASTTKQSIASKIASVLPGHHHKD